MFNFPNAPAQGEKYPATLTGNEAQYMWDGEKWVGMKEAAAPGGGGASVSTEDDPPLGPSDGDLWWESDTGKLFVAYEDGTSTQWVGIEGGGGGAGDFLPIQGGELQGPLKITSAQTQVGQLTIGGGDLSWIQGNATSGLPRWGISFPSTDGDFIVDLADDNGVWSWSPLRISYTTQAATFAGSLNAGTIISKTGLFNSQAALNANAHVSLTDWNGTVRSYFYWEHTSDVVIVQHQSAGINLSIATDGVHITNTADFWAGNGIKCRQGMSGAFGPNRFDAWYDTAGTTQWWIDATYMGTLTTASDYRIKKDVQPLASMWDKVKALKPVSYTHKEYFSPLPVVEQGDAEPRPLVVASDKERWGFIAHELQETLIEDAATGVKDQADCLQSPNPWTIIATLTKALQEAMTRIEALEARVA
jgi:Chaperone of endosialidase